MPRYSDWATPDPVERAPSRYWWDRAPFSESDVLRGTGPTYGNPQGTSTGFTMDVNEAGYAILRPPSFARTVGVYAAHDVVPAANVVGGVERPADSSQGTTFRIAELHISNGTYGVPFPDVMIPDGATIEWESFGEWIGDVSIHVTWSVRSGYSAGAGSNAAALCRVPATAVVDDAARTDVTLWAELAAMSDGAPFDVATMPNPVGNALNGGDPTSGEYTFSTPDATVCLAIRTPEQIDPIIPAVYPLTVEMVVGQFVGPSMWDFYGMGAQIDSIGLTRMFQAPRYRFVFPTRGAWLLRQRQSLTGSNGWPLRQRQNGGHSGSWPLRQRQRGV